NVSARLLKPITYKVRKAVKPVGEGCSEAFRFGPAKAAVHELSAKKWRVSDDSVDLRPYGFCAVTVQNGVAALDVIERFQNRAALNVEAVLAHPLDFANPHGNARQLRRVGIDFDAAHHLGRDRWKLSAKAHGLGLQVDAVL